MLIYVAGPYSAPTVEGCLENANKAIDAGIALASRGYTPFIPHLNHAWNQRANEQGTYYSHSWWMDWCLVWLAKCDGLLFLGHSKGADIELEFATRAGMPVYYSIDEIE